MTTIVCTVYGHCGVCSEIVVRDGLVTYHRDTDSYVTEPIDDPLWACPVCNSPLKWTSMETE